MVSGEGNKTQEKEITMQAVVINTSDGIVRVKVRRSSVINTLDKRHYDLLPGDKIEVKRQVNNPYLIRVQKD